MKKLKKQPINKKQIKLKTQINENNYIGYILVQCRQLNDQYECDADRTLKYVTKTYDDALRHVDDGGTLEIWGVHHDLTVTRIRGEYTAQVERAIRGYILGDDKVIEEYLENGLAEEDDI